MWRFSSIRPVHIGLIVSTLGVAAVLLYVSRTSTEAPPDAVYRIGFTDSPPVQYPGPAGGAQGVLVDAVNEAAKRANLRVSWYHCPGNSLDCLRSGKVDLVPAIAHDTQSWDVTTTDPFLRLRFWILSLDDREITANSKIRIAAAGPFTSSVIRSAFPSATIVSKSGQPAALQAVCEGSADATILADGTGESVLTHRDRPCASRHLRLRPFAGNLVWIGFGTKSTHPQAARVAGVLRSYVLQMVQDGTFATMLANAGLESAGDAMTIAELIETHRQGRIMRFSLAALVAALLATAWLAFRLKRAERSAAQASRTKGQFLANMSHEIRTPMNGVMGTAELLMRTPLTAEQAELVSTIHGSASTLLTLLNEILDLAKVEAGKIKLNLVPLRFGELISDVCRLISPSARRKNLEFLVDLDDGCYQSVLGDRLRLQQILLNLAGNAIKFTTRGSITIRVRTASIQAGAEQALWLRVEVIDTGNGIDQDTIKTLFQPFQQGAQDSGQRAAGAGLGLAISRLLVNHMGGNIGAESDVGKGSTFWFQLALAKTDRQPVLQAPVAAGNTDLSLGCRVLVVEDNSVNQLLIKKMLLKMGCEVTVVGDGETAVKVVGDKRFDVILMDWHLPGINGLETTAFVRELLGDLCPPIIAVTAHAMSGDREACLAAGMTGYLTKPIDFQSLSQAILAAVPDLPARVAHKVNKASL